MKRITPFVLIVLVALVAHAAQERATDENELLKLRQEWADAVVKRDATAFERIEDETFVFSGPNGKLWTKPQDIEALKSSTIDSAELDNMKVQLYGNAAVVTGRITYKGIYGGRDITGQYRVTDTFIKQDGKWRCVACGMSGPMP